MDIKRLKYFCTVVECGSFTKAAEMLHISQPPLSKRVQELEQEIGTPLLFRDGGRIRPTPTGFSFMSGRWRFWWALAILSAIR